MDERVAGRYRLEKPIGSGGMAEVWRATDTRSGAVVAVKRLHPGVARDETARARFRREVDASRAITHPAAVGVLDADPDADVPWLAMEHVEGGSLADALKDGPLEPRAVLSIASDAASALAALHAAGIVHRDVTPSNILLTDRGSRLADFGIARTWDGSALDDVTITGDLVGTMRFVAPEVLAGEPVTPAADVWALGAVIHEALTGTRPFDASSPGALLASQRTPPPAPSGLPDDVQATPGGMVAPDPARRPSADAVASTMSAAVDPGDDDPTRVIEAGTVAFASALPSRAIAADGAPSALPWERDAIVATTPGGAAATRMSSPPPTAVPTSRPIEEGSRRADRPWAVAPGLLVAAAVLLLGAMVLGSAALAERISAPGEGPTTALPAEAAPPDTPTSVVTAEPRDGGSGAGAANGGGKGKDDDKGKGKGKGHGGGNEKGD